MRDAPTFVCFLLITLAPLQTAAQGQDWPHWRGPDSNGVSVAETVNPAALLPQPKVLWTASLGVGFSSPSVKGGLVYCAGNVGGQDTVTCLDAETGRQVWKYSYACAVGSYPGPKATPTVEGNAVYTLSREGYLLALDASTGKVQWARHLVTDFGITRPDYDFAGSPVISGDLLILNAGRSGLALKKSTGARVWGGDGGSGGYAAPVLAEMGGKQMVVIFGHRAVFGVAVRNGKVEWSFDWETGSDVNAADPVVMGHKVFVTSAYGKGSALYDVSGPKPLALWQNQAFATHFSSFVERDGYLYGIDGDARMPNAGSLRCVELRTGRIAWRAPLGFGSLIAGRDTLVVLTSSGSIVAADMSPLAYTERGRGSLPRGQYWTPPALAQGRLFIRGVRGDLFAIDVR
jgi:outer membrane protein assembly factor BamB